MSKKIDEEVVKGKEAWEKTTLKKRLDEAPERSEHFTTISGEEIGRLYGPWDLGDWDYTRDLGFPGQHPYTRGIHPTMYRGRLLDDAPVRRLFDRAADQPPI